jgi:hypothetical protein
MGAQAKKKPLQRPPAKQSVLALTYSVGDWVWVKLHSRRHATPKKPGENIRRMLARIESAQPLTSALGDAWLVRCYYTSYDRGLRGGWAATLEHRQIDRALNPKEVADLRNQGVIPVAGGIEVLP